MFVKLFFYCHTIPSGDEIVKKRLSYQRKDLLLLLFHYYLHEGLIFCFSYFRDFHGFVFCTIH